MENDCKDLRNTVFVVMPFSDTVAEDCYRDSTREIVREFQMSIVRADEIFSANPIFDDIIAAIQQAAIIIVDISGRNPNCFYELGVAHTLKRSRTIMITHDSVGTAPFDIAHFRIIEYENSIAGKTKYEERLRRTLSSVRSGIPEIYSDEFEFLLRILKANEMEYRIWALQALARIPDPLTPTESAHVEGTCPNWPKDIPGQAGGERLGEFVEVFSELGYLHVMGGKLKLTEKGRGFSDYVTARGYQVYLLNDFHFVPDYIPLKQRGLKFKVAPEPK